MNLKSACGVVAGVEEHCLADTFLFFKKCHYSKNAPLSWPTNPDRFRLGQTDQPGNINGRFYFGSALRCCAGG